MANPTADELAGEIVIGGGLHAAIFAATRYQMYGTRTVVLERERSAGGVFSRLLPFWLNSVNGASIKSVTEGPSKILPESETDDLNYLFNSAHQVRDMTTTEYPASNVMALAVSRTLRDYATVYTNQNVTIISPFTNQINVNGEPCRPRRVFDARGLQMRSPRVTSDAVMTAEKFLSSPFMMVADMKKVAIVGGGDTAAIVAEYILGQSPARPPFMAREIAWFSPGLAGTKSDWTNTRQARYLGLARHFPQNGVTGMIRPVLRTGVITSLGNKAAVNGDVFDLVVDCTGFASAFEVQTRQYSLTELPLTDGVRKISNYYVIGAAASNTSFTADESRLGFDRFPQNVAAIFRLGKITAQLAANVPPLS